MSDRVNRYGVFVNESVFAILYLLTRADCTSEVSEQLIVLLFRPYFENFYRQLCATVKCILRNFLEIISSIKTAQTQSDN